jgi:peroxiredoxin
MYAQLKAKGFELITVNLGDDDKTIDGVLKGDKLSLRVLKDDQKVSAAYKVTAIPTNYVIGPDGKIIKAFLGFDPEGIKAAVNKALKRP